MNRQKSKMPRIVHIVNEAFDFPVSGTDLRNFSINSALALSGDVNTICLNSIVKNDSAYLNSLATNAWQFVKENHSQKQVDELVTNHIAQLIASD